MKHSASFAFLSILSLCATGCTIVTCNHNVVTDEAVAPTCTEEGLTEGSHCSICGEVIVAQKVIPTIEHSWVSENVYCSLDGANQTTHYKCSSCNATKDITTSVGDHSHRYEKHNSKEASCEDDGNIEYYDCSCETCFVKENDTYKVVDFDDVVINKLGHVVVNSDEIAPTCDNEGSTGGKHCSKCGKIIEKGNVVPALGHSYSLHQGETLPHFSFNECGRCETKEYTLPVINIDCESELTSDYSACKITTSECLEKYQITDIDAQVKIRGNWSAKQAKKPYRIKFNKKQSLFGLNNDLKTKSWVLLAEYGDKSMVRNATAFYLASKLYGGKYYSSDCAFVEVKINNSFQGIYLLAEQQQVGKGRVDVFEEKDNISNNIGFLVEYDQYYADEDEGIVFDMTYGSIPFLNDVIADDSHFIDYYVIKSDIYSDSQRLFIKDRMQKIWNVAYDTLCVDHSNVSISPYKTIDDEGDIIEDSTITSAYSALSKIIDVESLLDTYLLNEIVQNMDIGYSSFYLSLDMSDSGNKKLTFQAPWDFDWCFGNSVQNIEKLYLGNYLEEEPNHEKSNPWLLLVSNSQWFWKMLQDKWNEIGWEKLRDDTISMIETFTDQYGIYIDKEYAKWTGKSNFIVWCSSDATLKAKTQKEDSVNVVSYLNHRFNALDYYFEDLTRVSNSFIS